MPESNIAIRRLYHQRLEGDRLDSPGQAAAWFGAVQSQMYDQAKWGLALRMEQASDASIEEAFNRGEILRTHLLRPTWHFVARDDIRWLLELTGPRVKAGLAGRYRQLELDERTLAYAAGVIAAALQGGKHLTRGELGDELNRAEVQIEGQRFPHMLMHAELLGVICSGSRRGKQHTYALLEERAPQARSLPLEEARAELVRRYFTSHGPATLADFAWWSGLTQKDARAGIAEVGGALVEEVIDGPSYWYDPHVRAAKVTVPTANLLPAFDEYTVAYRDRSAVMDGEHSALFTREPFGGAVLVGGMLAGHWKRSLEKGRARVQYLPWRHFSAAEQRACEQAARQLGNFLDLAVEMEWKSARN